MSLFPRYIQEFSPLFRLIDDYDRVTRNSFSQLQQFQPKFDVKELKDSYELHGELPGIEQKNVNIEWTDHNTLSIRGRTETRFEKGTPPKAIAGTEQKSIEATQSDDNVETESVASSHKYRQPSVEEDGELVEKPTSSDKHTAKTEAEQPTSSDAVTTTTLGSSAVAKPTEPAQEQAKYWVSERSVGEFHRSFTFPVRVEQDAVKASLKNGILSIVVPKAKPQRTPRTIQIE